MGEYCVRVVLGQGTLLTRFRRYGHMILRFATDLSVPFTNDEAERAIGPGQIQQQRTLAAVAPVLFAAGRVWRLLSTAAQFERPI